MVKEVIACDVSSLAMFVYGLSGYSVGPALYYTCQGVIGPAVGHGVVVVPFVDNIKKIFLM